MSGFKPRDGTEERAAGIGGRITKVIGVVIGAAVALCGAVGGLEWLAGNLPLLGTGVGGIALGGITCWVAVRRMRVDRASTLDCGGPAPLSMTHIKSGAEPPQSKVEEKDEA